jgi:hypothetical protein
VLPERLDRLAALRGDPARGIPVTAWATNLDDVDRDLLLRAVIETIRTLVLPDWEAKRPDDRRPQDALAATEAWLETRSADAVNQAKTTAKACTAARNDTYGYDHRIADAARAVAWAVTAKDNAPIWDALASIEEELLARVALVGEYHRVPEQRKAILGVLRRVLIPPAKVESPENSAPVKYSASGSFSVGQKLIHAVFGDLVVTAVQDKTIDVTLPDGSTKRLAHKPK